MAESSTTRTRVALIGCGNISRRYVTGIGRLPDLELVGCTDAIPELASALAAEAGIRAYDDLDQLLADPGVDIVVNITPPLMHAAVTIKALEAGKHVYVEKPIAASSAAAREVLEASDRTGRKVGSAPDTFLGSAFQAARTALDSGVIGDVIGASAFITSSRAETWHPDPTFLFTEGGGPLLDLGPYYVAVLVNLFGSVRTVSGAVRIGAPTRNVTSKNRRVDEIVVTVPTHASATLTFENDAIATFIASFDIWDSELPKLEVYGTEGTMSLPDPNTFDEPVRIKRHGDADWNELSLVLPPFGAPGSYDQYLRGLGVLDLARAVGGAPSRASGAMGLHVLDVLESVISASEQNAVISVASHVDRPALRNK